MTTRPTPAECSLREDVRDIRTAVVRLDEKVDRNAAAVTDQLDRINLRLDVLIDGLSVHIREDH